MRTPVPTHAPAPSDQQQELAERLASLLVAEWKARHPQVPQDQQIVNLTVGSPSGLNHSDHDGGDER